jgi:3-methyladenine DNA glycosylase Mpg
MNHCFNVVSGEIGAPEAVLIRALHPQEGVELMKKMRSSISEFIDFTIYIDTPFDIAMVRRIDVTVSTIDDVQNDSIHYVSRGRASYLKSA